MPAIRAWRRGNQPPTASRQNGGLDGRIGNRHLYGSHVDRSWQPPPSGQCGPVGTGRTAGVPRRIFAGRTGVSGIGRTNHSPGGEDLCSAWSSPDTHVAVFLVRRKSRDHRPATVRAGIRDGVSPGGVRCLPTPGLTSVDAGDRRGPFAARPGTNRGTERFTTRWRRHGCGADGCVPPGRSAAASRSDCPTSPRRLPRSPEHRSKPAG